MVTLVAEFEAAAKHIALEAGKVIREASFQEKRVNLKCSVADLVTETDQAVEKMIISFLKEKFPTHSFPYSCVSIALMINKQTEVAVVYNPNLDDMFCARPGKGAFCNDKPIHVSDVTELSKALLCAEFGSSRDPAHLDAKVGTMRTLIDRAHGIRSLGSAAMNMCAVAQGYAEGYYEMGLHCWDYAAGYLIVREAGGFVSNINDIDGELDMLARNVVCGNSRDMARSIAKHVTFIEYEKD